MILLVNTKLVVFSMGLFRQYICQTSLGIYDLFGTLCFRVSVKRKTLATISHIHTVVGCRGMGAITVWNFICIRWRDESRGRKSVKRVISTQSASRNSCPSCCGRPRQQLYSLLKHPHSLKVLPGVANARKQIKIRQSVYIMFPGDLQLYSTKNLLSGTFLLKLSLR